MVMGCYYGNLTIIQNDISVLMLIKHDDGDDGDDDHSGELGDV